MATTYSSRFYTSAGVVVAPTNFSKHGLQGAEFNETIATTVIDGVDEHYLMPFPSTGIHRLHGFWLAAGDMDTGGPTLDADLVYRYVLNGVATDVTIYDSSVSGLFSAALTMKWVTAWRIMEFGERGDLVFKTLVAATTPAAVNLTVMPRWS